MAMNSLIFIKSFSLLLNHARSIYLSNSLRNEFRSAYNLQNLYPKSSLKITTPSAEEVLAKSKEKFSGYIPLDKVKISACHASGPGGQHVNSRNTKVELRFNLESADWIPEEMKKKLLEKKKNQLTKEGELILRSDKTRSYQMNLADVLQRLRTIIYNSYEPIKEPNPEWEITIRKRKERANEERLKMKRHRSFIKACRRDFE